MTKSLLTVAALLALATPAFAQKSAGDTVTTKSGLRYVMTTKNSEGRKAQSGETVVAHYHGTFLDGRVFDSSRERNKPFEFVLGQGQVIKGWDEAFAMLRTGERATLIIPPDLAYGSTQRGPIPANSTLVFEVELVEIRKPGFAQLYAKTIETSGIESAVALCEKHKEKGFQDYHLSEDQMNRVGYSYLQRGRHREAIETFKLNVDNFPNSANVYDSLGEAYMAAGNKEEAISNYKRSLELDPNNSNAVEMLKRLSPAE